MKTFHLYVLLKTIYEASPAEELLSLGFTPGQLSGLIIEATQDGLLERHQQTLLLSESGLERLNAFRSRGDLIRPDGQWIKEAKGGKSDATAADDIYVPYLKKSQ